MLIVDEATDYCRSYFLKAKSETTEKIVYFIKEIQDSGVHVQYLRCDNAVVNKIAEKMCMENQLGVRFEYTAPHTPQQNGVVEQKFAALWGHMRVHLQAINNTSIKNGCWAEAANKATHDNNRTIHAFQRGSDPYLFTNIRRSLPWYVRTCQGVRVR